MGKPRKDRLYRCWDCGWYIGGVLLDKDHYDMVCPMCNSEVDIEFQPTPQDLRELNKRIQPHGSRG